jgi:2-dehydropantoate 2-reductase
MRIAIVGAGAMGTLLGHGFSKGGHNVTMLDLPDRVEQLRAAGELIVIAQDGSESAAKPALVTSDFSLAGKHEVVILACKAQDLTGVARDVTALTDSESIIVTIQNGIPWWYLQGLPNGLGNKRIQCLDPEGMLERFIDPSQIVGCVAYPAANLEPDGRARHVEGYRFPVGELDGSVRDRTRVISSLFEDGGFKSRIIDDIRSEIWLKAWGALSINPISALTRATMEDICSYSETRELVAQMMLEAQQIAEALGAHFRHTIEKRIEGAKAVGAHKTSMLQDVENGLPLELDALMLAILELAEMTGKPAPAIRNIYACTALLNNNLSRA